MTQPDLSILAPDDGEPGNLAEVSAGNPNQPIAMAALRGYEPWTYTGKGAKTDWNRVVQEVSDYLNDPNTGGALKPLTLRQLEYHLIGLGYSKTLYKQLSDYLAKARRAGLIDWDDMVDNSATRSFLYPESGPSDAVARAKHVLTGGYYRDRQEAQPTRLVILTETAGMVPQMARLGRPYGIEAHSGGGQPSVDFCRSMALRLRDQCETGDNDDALCLWVSDHDPGGERIVRVCGEDITAFGAAHGITIRHERVALTAAQVATLGLSTQSVNLNDQNAADFLAAHGDATTQAEAVPPAALARMMTDAIEARMLKGVYEFALDQERADKAELARKAALLDGTEGEPT